MIFNTNKILMQYCILLVLHYSIALASFFLFGHKSMLNWHIYLLKHVIYLSKYMWKRKSFDSVPTPAEMSKGQSDNTNNARLNANSGLMAEGIPTNNQRGRRSGPCRLWGGLDKARHIVCITLLVRVQCFRKGLYKAVEKLGPSTRPLDDQWVILSSKAFNYFRTRRD